MITVFLGGGFETILDCPPAGEELKQIWIEKVGEDRALITAISGSGETGADKKKKSVTMDDIDFEALHTIKLIFDEYEPR